MSNTLSKIVIFVAGAAIGSVTTWALVKHNYERRAEEEIDAMREYYMNRQNENNDSENDSTPRIVRSTNDRPGLMEYAALVHANGYISNDLGTDEEEPVMELYERPYVIEPDDFGTKYGYGAVSLTYYADGVLVDDQTDEILEEDDVESTIGIDSLSHFGEYEDHSVFVRNDELMTDYEILLDLRNYKDVMTDIPHHAEDE